MDLNTLHTFVTVVQKKSMSQATESLGYAKATISVQMASLQKEFGCPLLIRSGRSFTLSKEGEKLYSHALQILNIYEQAKLDLSQNAVLCETLTIGMIESLHDEKLAEMITLFQTMYPHVRIRMMSDTIDGLVQMLDTHRIDLALLVDMPIHDYRFETVILNQEQVHFVHHRHYSVPAVNCIQDLKNCPLLLTERNASYRQLLDQICAAENIVLEPIIETPNTDFLMTLLKQRNGISFLPDYVITKHSRSDDFLTFSLTEIQITLYSQILMDRSYQSRATRQFTQLLKENTGV